MTSTMWLLREVTGRDHRKHVFCTEFKPADILQKNLCYNSLLQEFDAKLVHPELSNHNTRPPQFSQASFGPALNYDCDSTYTFDCIAYSQ